MIHDQKGMSLIEVLVTIVILGIVFSLISQTTNFVSTATRIHNDKAEAITLAEHELNNALDLLKNGTTPSSSTQNGYIVQVHINETGTQSPNPATSKHVSLSGVHVEASKPKVVTVTVSWGD